MLIFSELIKKFDKIRDYMRDFYVYGFRTRENFESRKSLRSYDNERRRIESYLEDFMSFRQNDRGKIVFLSADSRDISANPFYRAFKAKSFTKKDISLHFILLDILQEGIRLSLSEIMEKIGEEYLSFFQLPMEIDAATVRNKLREYEGEGLFVSEKVGKTLFYRRREEKAESLPSIDALRFFSEADPAGVIGSFLLDRYEEKHPVNSPFSYKHHYIMHALDSEIFCLAAEAIAAEETVEILRRVRSGREEKEKVFPIKILLSVQSGRSYLSAYHFRDRHIFNYRLDHILSLRRTGERRDACGMREKWKELMDETWGVSFGKKGMPESVEMILLIPPQERFVLERILREGRHGRVEELGEGRYRYAVKVRDSREMLPWLRTFLGRIEQIRFSDEKVEKLFYADLENMRRKYEEPQSLRPRRKRAFSGIERREEVDLS